MTCIKCGEVIKGDYRPLTNRERLCTDCAKEMDELDLDDDDIDLSGYDSEVRK